MLRTCIEVGTTTILEDGFTRIDSIEICHLSFQNKPY